MNHERIGGVVIGKVTGVKDKEQLGRIEVTYPWLNGPVQRMVPVAAPMAGPDAGLFFMPDIDDEVMLAFDQGQFDHPYVIGFLWNAKQKPPSTDERERMIRSKNGHTIRFVDSTPVNGNQGALIIEDAGGNTIVMTNSHMTIKARGALVIDAASVTIGTRVVRMIGPPI
jgi:uncharacterized protein involved in type VI secretion and phage assembly